MMSGVDIIWTTLGILMVVCVCIDSGMTVFSVIQVIQLGEALLVIACPLWTVWSFVFALNLPLEAVCIFGTRKYIFARAMMAVHVNLKLIVLFHLATRGELFWVTHYLNQGILVMLLVSSASSSFVARSSNAKQQAGRSSHKPTASATHQIAFVRGLY